MHNVKKYFVTLLALQLLVISFAGGVMAQTYTDIKDHFAEPFIMEAIERGYVNGYPDGTFKPDKTVTRAEFIKILNQAYKAWTNNTNEIKFTDLSPRHWAYEDVLLATQLGYANGTSSTTFSPDKLVTKQEAAVMIQKLLKLKGEVPASYDDAEEVALWAREEVSLLTSMKVIHADHNKKINPKHELTRAEVVIIMNNLENIVDREALAAVPFESQPALTIINGDVTITSSNLTLENTHIIGNLYVDSSVDASDIYLKKVRVSGEMIVKDVAPSSLHLDNSYFYRITVNSGANKANPTHVVATGSTVVHEIVNNNSSVIIEESTLADIGFKWVTLSQSTAGVSTTLNGDFEMVRIQSNNAQVNVESGRINEFFAPVEADYSVITLAEQATIMKLILNAYLQVLGTGTIEQAEISILGKDSSFSKSPNTIIDKYSNQYRIPGMPLVDEDLYKKSSINMQAPVLKSFELSGVSSYKLYRDNVYFSDVNGQLQLGASHAFSPRYAEYEIIVPDDSIGKKINLFFEYEGNAEVYYFNVMGDTLDIKYLNLISTNDNKNQYEFTYETNKTYSIRVRLTNPDTLSKNLYYFSIQTESKLFNELNM